MIINDILNEKKHLCRLVLSDGREILLDRDVVAFKCLHKEDNITEEALSLLIEASDYERAKQRAIWYLDRSFYTEKALYEKLVRAGFNKKAVAAVVARLCELDLLNDRRFAEIYLKRCIEANISKREAYQKMLLKGLPRELIIEFMENTEIDEAAQIREIIEKKYRLKLSNPENVQKVYAALARKGFSYSAVRQVIADYCEEIRFSEEC